MFIVKKLSDNSKEYLNTYYDIIDQMSKAINGCEIGKSIGGLYINQITPLLQASIDLNNNILKYTTNTDIENFAKNMTFDRNNEIQKLSEITETCACVCNSERDVKLYMRKFNEVNGNMMQRLNSAPATNNLDMLYLTTMTTLLEGGIGFSKNVLAYNICPDLKDFATNLIDEMNLQISTIKSIIKNL